MFKITDLDYTIDEYLTFCDMKNLSKKTLKSYDQTLKLLSKYLLEYHNINSIKQIKKNHIEEYIAFSKNKGKYTFVANQNSKSINYPENRGDFETKISACTVNNYLRNIKAFFNWCA
ncbi:site-specific integrase [Clostridium felsineum]|uniref:site-specific integrase n=1 Tax=Clostridium felsineum TaxID=36839 RepID=UPI0009D55D46|nr:hypothetical protein CLFE_024100 [Clostridium felsineum DSM 794]